jgi:methylated-DNA-[protein]-cysteine S-methyltransferase
MLNHGATLRDSAKMTHSLQISGTSGQPEEGYTWHMKKTFSDKVRDIVRKIPKGKTMTYKMVASEAGNPKAARAVGAVMRSNYDPSIPCHRVVASDAKIRGYNRGARIR